MSEGQSQLVHFGLCGRDSVAHERQVLREQVLALDTAGGFVGAGPRPAGRGPIRPTNRSEVLQMDGFVLLLESVFDGS